MKFTPPEASVAPRYTGIRTFARAPLRRSPEGVDAAILGVPFDTATSMRPGARFGPAGIRDASLLLRPFNPAQAVDVFDALSLADLGDLHTTPGNAERTTAQIAAQLEPVLRAGATPITLGGDHSIVLGELRAHAAVHGPLGGRPARRPRRHVGAVLRRALLPRHAVQARVGGGPDRSRSQSLGRHARVAVRGLRSRRAARVGLRDRALRRAAHVDAAEYAARVAARVGDGPAFLSFDIDCIDPAFAPATGTPEVCGLLPHEAIAFLRALRGMTFTGYDLVEVAPAYDTNAQTTALLAANIAYEFLTLTALSRA